MLNTCPAATLAEILRFLKRCYWPFAWTTAPAAAPAGAADGGAALANGGFANAAQVWLEGEDSAELQAIAMTARHRLERGIWTSPGAGELGRNSGGMYRLAQ